MPEPESILAEHRALHALIEALRRDVAVPRGREAGWRAAIAVQLGELRLRLEEHFSGEERRGLFERLAEAGTEGLPAAGHLRREHDALRERLGRLCDEAGQGGGPAGAHVLSARLNALLGDLEAHEERENEALVRSLDGSVAAAD